MNRGLGLTVELEHGTVLRSIIDAFAEIFTRLEVRDVFSGERHRLTRLGVTANPRRTVMERKAAKAPDFNPVSVGKGATHLIKQALDSQLYILLFEVPLLAR